MKFKSKIGRDFIILKEQWKKWVAIRLLLKSSNFKFVSDFPPGHFYSPIPDIEEIRKRKDDLSDQTVKNLPGINLNEAYQLKLLAEFSNLTVSMPFSDHKDSRWRYYFDNPYFSYGDAIVLLSIFRHFKPKRVIEAGSGYSSVEMMDLNDCYFDKKINFTLIEPYPERLLGLLAPEDLESLCLEKKSLQQVALSRFDSLEANDVFFIDSSHVGKTGSDVLHILFRILPLLKRGVLVHFHDILWPFEYPLSWIEGGRAWNEAYFLRTFLQDNPNWEIIYFNSFMACHHRALIEKQIPAVLKSPSSADTFGNSSLWLRKVA